MFADEVRNLLQWIDDFLLHAETKEKLLMPIEKFFLVCKQFGFLRNLTKTHRFKEKVRFCVRIISEDGVQYNPRSYQVLIEMNAPTHANELQQFLCATNWMRTSIADYVKRV